MTRRVIEGILVAVLVLLMLSTCAYRNFVMAHETLTGWAYDNACCSDQHCHPVKDGVVEDKVDGVHVQGFGILSYTDQRLRRSGDNNDHVCTSEGKLLCVYEKPKGM
jgi:hypothetical protein